MSRTDARSRSLRRRPSRTVPAVVVALLLLTLGVALVWITVLRLTTGAWPEIFVQAAQWAHDVTWGSTTAITAAAAAAVGGLIMLLCAIIPGHHTSLRVSAQSLNGEDGQTEVVMSRRSIARLATARADEVDGVGSVSTSAGSRSVSLSITTPSEQRDVVANAVRATVQEAFRAAGIEPLPKIAVNARTQE